MPVYDRDNVPEHVGRGTLDPELAAWLPTGPVLGADESVAEARRSHHVLGEFPLPAIGSVEHLVLDGPHGSLPVRVHTPSEPAGSPCGALVYIHGGGFTVGTLDEFESVRTLQRAFAGLDESLSAYIRRLRLEEAAAALTASGTRLSVSEAAALWHFTDSSHFIRAFKKQYDATPAQFARRVT